MPEYRKPGFNCESMINANCDISPRTQLLIGNDRLYTGDPRVNATLQLRKMSILLSLKPVTGNNLPTPDKAGLSANITKEVNQWVEKAIGINRRAADNVVKGKYNRQVCS